MTISDKSYFFFTFMYSFSPFRFFLLPFLSFLKPSRNIIFTFFFDIIFANNTYYECIIFPLIFSHFQVPSLSETQFWSTASTYFPPVPLPTQGASWCVNGPAEQRSEWAEWSQRHQWPNCIAWSFERKPIDHGRKSQGTFCALTQHLGHNSAGITMKHLVLKDDSYFEAN